MNARDRIYTGKVGEWGLPDWTVIKDRFGTCHYLNALADTVQGEHTIEKLPAGYKFNKQGEIIKVEQKRYWNGKDKLEVGMIVVVDESKNREYACMLPPDKIGVVVLNYMGAYVNRHFSSLASIDTRTDKDKAVDFIVSIGVNREFALSVVDRIIDGKIHGVKWVGEDVTNNQWLFQDAQHVALAVGGSIEPCGNCIKAIITELQKEL